MSKLEDKLSASLKPARSKPAAAAKVVPTAKEPSTGRPSPKPRAAEQETRPVTVERPLHPRRVWPD